MNDNNPLSDSVPNQTAQPEVSNPPAPTIIEPISSSAGQPPSPTLPEEPPPSPIVNPVPPQPKLTPKRIITIAIVFLVVVSIPAAIFLVKQRQEIRKGAVAEPAILLGRVVNSDPLYSSCHQSLYFYGDNCGNDSLLPPCFGAPNYRVTWTQGGKSKSISNNSCYPSDGPDRPRFTFEERDEDNPFGDADGEEVTISIAMDSNVLLQLWSLETTDSRRNVLPGSRQSGTFANPGPNQTITVKVYHQDALGGDDYRWNHVHFEAAPPTPTPTPTATPTPTPGPTAQCREIKAYNLSWNPLDATKLSQLKAGDTVRFTVLGQTSAGTFEKARFRVNSTSWLPETTTKKPGTEEFYIEYTLPDGVTTFSVEAEVYHQTLGWQ